jgi:hypothetical protein
LRPSIDVNVRGAVNTSVVGDLGLRRRKGLWDLAVIDSRFVESHIGPKSIQTNQARC